MRSHGWPACIVSCRDEADAFTSQGWPALFKIFFTCTWVWLAALQDILMIIPRRGYMQVPGGQQEEGEMGGQGNGESEVGVPGAV